MGYLLLIYVWHLEFFHLYQSALLNPFLNLSLTGQVGFYTMTRKASFSFSAWSSNDKIPNEDDQPERGNFKVAIKSFQRFHQPYFSISIPRCWCRAAIRRRLRRRRRRRCRQQRRQRQNIRPIGFLQDLRNDGKEAEAVARGQKEKPRAPTLSGLKGPGELWLTSK